MSIADHPAHTLVPISDEDDHGAVVQRPQESPRTTSAPAGSLNKAGSFTQQLRALLWKSWLIKSRVPLSSLSEILLPVIIMVVLIAIRIVIKNTNYPPTSYLANSPPDGWAELLKPQSEWTVIPPVQHQWDAAATASFMLGEPPNQLTSFDSNAPYYTSLLVFAPDTAGTVDLAELDAMASAFKSLYANQPAPYTSFNSSNIRVFASTNDISSYIDNSHYGYGDAYPPIWAAVVISKMGTATDPTFGYSIRMNSSTSIDTSSVPYYNNVKETYSSDWIKLWVEGQMLLQNFVETYFIQQTANIALQRSFFAAPFPTPAYDSDPFITALSTYLGLFITIVYVWPVSRVLKNIVEDKETRVKEAMKIMSASECAIYTSYLITYTIIFAITAALITAVTSSTVFEYSNKGFIFLFFFIFGMSAFAFAFLLSSCFSRARVAATVGSLIFLVSFFPFYALTTETSSGGKILASLSTTIAFGETGTVIADWESGAVGIQNNNFATNNSNYNYSYAIGIAMMVFDFIWYSLLSMYISRVLPSEWGVKQPVCFCFMPSFWFPKKVRRDNMQNMLLDDNDDCTITVEPKKAMVFEPVPADIRQSRAISIKNLRKDFYFEGEVRHAVNIDRLDLYEGQILALLGHNGAGKTTLMAMLSGLLQPTSGDASIYGLSINKSMNGIRQILGFVPQHNILFPELTALEHLIFFARLKGNDPKKARGDSEAMLHDFGLSDRMHVLAHQLSGGQKRKLSLAIALIGDSKVLFIDEFSSGVDVASRRALWHAIEKNKAGRCIILTTHHLEEAEFLGDRIAIMASGEIRAVGSGLFLKSHYGVGYSMTIIKTKFANDSDITDLVLSHVPSAQPVTNVAGELSFRLALSDNDRFPALFDAMDASSQALGIQSYGISATTLEEVFIKSSEVEDSSSDTNQQLQQKSRSNNALDGKNGSFVDKSISLTSSPVTELSQESQHQSAIDELLSVKVEPGSEIEVFWRHFRALFVKRYINAKRDRKLQLWTILYPLLAVLIGLIILKVVTLSSKSVSVNFSPLNGGQPTPVVFSANAPGAAFLPFDSTAGDVSIFGSSKVRFESVQDVGTPQLLNDYLIDSIDSQRLSRFVAIISNTTQTDSTIDDNFSLMFNTTSDYALPLAYNLYSSALLRAITGNQQADIHLDIFPLPATANQKTTVNAVLGIFLSIGFAFIPAAYASFQIMEVYAKIKHQQLISGVTLFSYWLSNYAWDLINYTIPAAFVMVLVAIFNVQSLLGDAVGPMIIGLILFGIAIIPFCYCLSFFFRNATAGQNSILFALIILGALLNIASAALSYISSTQAVNSNLKFLYRIFPIFCIGELVNNLLTRSIPLLWQGNSYGPWALQISGYPMIFMAWEALFFTGLLLVIEYIQSTPALLSLFSRLPDVPLEQFEEKDVGVRTEREQLMKHAGVCGEENCIIEMHGLRKVFPAKGKASVKVAVNDLWLRVFEGECFGFLGVNGAGKTTAMSLLTGDELPTSGTAFLKKFDIRTQQVHVRRLLGYCPQFDALIPLLTARETLTLFARIKGIPQNVLDKYVTALLSQLCLQPGIEDRPVKGYSGGNRRKVSLGVALIGGPAAVFLDEITAGVDPGSSRALWNLISKTNRSRSCLLTSHSMAEVEALCSRISIMTNGRLSALGTAQELKQRYGHGYLVEISVAHDASVTQASSAVSDAIQRWMLSTFPDSVPVEMHTNHFRYKISKQQPDGTTVTIPMLFRKLQADRRTLSISEYSVSEYSLEQIFIEFAKEAEQSATT